uniref:UBA domain-containing protein n=1 Tax=Rhabditophanes sp. KR3021 TaxID=114890 RepID=A0AC35U0T5_9BILA
MVSIGFYGEGKCIRFKVSPDDKAGEIINKLVNENSVPKLVESNYEYGLTYGMETIGWNSTIKDFFAGLFEKEQDDCKGYPSLVLAVKWNQPVPEHVHRTTLINEETVGELYESLSNFNENFYDYFIKIWKNNSNRAAFNDKNRIYFEDETFTSAISDHQFGLHLLKTKNLDYFTKYPGVFHFMYDMNVTMRETNMLPFKEKVMNDVLAGLPNNPDFAQFREAPEFQRMVKSMVETLRLIHHDGNTTNNPAQNIRTTRELMQRAQRQYIANNPPRQGQEFNNLSNLMNQIEPAAQAPAPVPVPDVDERVVYQEALRQMQEFGFSNVEENIAHLRMTNGDIESALSLIILSRESAMETNE